MSIDAQTSGPSAFHAGVNPLARRAGALRLAAMIISGGAMLFPVTWAVIFLGMSGLTAPHPDGVDSTVADALAMAGPMLLGWLVVAVPVTAVFLRTAGHPAADGGKVWMGLSAGFQLLALPIWALAGTAGTAGWSNFDLGLTFMVVATVLCLLGIPLAIVGWSRFGWRTSRPVRVAPSLD